MSVITALGNEYWSKYAGDGEEENDKEEDGGEENDGEEEGKQEGSLVVHIYVKYCNNYIMILKIKYKILLHVVIIIYTSILTITGLTVMLTGYSSHLLLIESS